MTSSRNKVRAESTLSSPCHGHDPLAYHSGDETEHSRLVADKHRGVKFRILEPLHEGVPKRVGGRAGRRVGVGFEGSVVGHGGGGCCRDGVY